MDAANLVLAIAEGVDAGDQLEGLGLIALAAVLGGIIGAERSLQEKPAGLRTHMVVSSLAAGVVFMGELLSEVYGRGDPSRALHAVITGIGFLGAGTIIVNREKGVIGLTTAAGLMFAATVGVMVGLGLVILAVGSTVLVVVVVHLLGPLDSKLQRMDLPGSGRSGDDPHAGDPGGDGAAERDADRVADEVVADDPNTASPHRPGGGGGGGGGRDGGDRPAT